MKEADAILVEWEFGTLVERFKSNVVDEDVLGHLTVEHIVALIPEIGIRRKFMEKWKTTYENVKTSLNEIATSTVGTPRSNADSAANSKIVLRPQESHASTSKESPSNESVGDETAPVTKRLMIPTRCCLHHDPE